MTAKEEHLRATIRAIDRADEQRIWWEQNGERVRPLVRKVQIMEIQRENQARARKRK